MKYAYFENEAGAVHLAEVSRHAAGTDQDIQHELGSDGNSRYQICSFVRRDDTLQQIGLRPRNGQIADATETLLPRYLFRVTHAYSAGKNEEGMYQSGTVFAGTGKSNFFSSAYDNKYIRETLRNHLHHKMVWSPWISFTDSIASTLARATKSIRKGYPNIKIHVVDTFQINKQALVVDAFAMARGYGVFSDRSSIRAKMVLGSLFGEVLVWNELEVEASTVPFDALLHPKPPRPNAYAVGLLEIMPMLEVQPGPYVKKVKKTPRNFSASEWDARKKFTAAWELKKRFYGLELMIEEKKQSDQVFAPKKAQQQAHGGRMGRKIWFKTSEMPDNRVHVDESHIRQHQMLISEFKPEFQIPMLIALLSMRTREFYEGGIVEIMRPEFFGKCYSSSMTIVDNV